MESGRSYRGVAEAPMRSAGRLTPLPAAPRQAPVEIPMPEVIEGYKIERKLGQGGFGTTYLATKKGRRYVLKHMASKYAVLEHKQLMDLGYNCKKHFNCPVELIQRASATYLVTEFIPGTDLGRLTSKDMGEQFYDMMIEQLLEALTTLHGIGIVHRDIKPDNIMYEEATETFFLIDFGLACTRACTIKGCSGTPLYMSPYYTDSCLLGEEPTLDVLMINDMFSMAVTFFMMIEHMYPYEIVNRYTYNYSEPTLYLSSTPQQQEAIEALFVGERSAGDILRQFRSTRAQPVPQPAPTPFKGKLANPFKGKPKEQAQDDAYWAQEYPSVFGKQAK
jgi:serine/threonine protein kinase